MSKLTNAQSFEIQIAVDIKAVPDMVWNAIVNETDAWWLPDFYCAPHSKKITIEPWPGGRMFEEADNGGGLLWYTVQAIEPPRSINLTGHLSPPYGGPATNLLHIAVDGKSNATTVRVTNWVFGKVDESLRDSLDEGWRQLFEQGLKKFVEQ